MLAFFVRRLLSFLVVLPVSFVTVFLLVRITGNPIANALGDRLSEEELARRVAAAGLDQPWHIQFVGYMDDVLRGSFGETITGEKVLPKVLSHLVATIEVTFLGVLLLVVIIFLSALLAARFQNSAIDFLISKTSIVTYALPAFVGAVLIREIANVVFPSFESVGRLSLEGQLFWEKAPSPGDSVLLFSLMSGNATLLIDSLQHMLLPALAMLLVGGTLIRVFRDSLVEELNSEQIRNTRLRGIPANRALLKHALVPSLPPLLANLGVTIGLLITGVVFIEKVFEIRGLGYLLIDSVLARDFMLVQAIFLVTFFIVTSINFLVDVSIALIDKRQARQLL